MRSNTNYPNRIAEQTDRIRKIAATLPAWQKHTLLNACGMIELTSRRHQYAPTNTEQHEAIKEQHDAVLDIVNALLSGRVLSYKNEGEFYTSQFHTAIVYARRKMEKAYPQYRFCSKWTTDGGHPYKLYWIESTINE